jgi:LysR family nitrogen assimilation transcriptional regulator
MELRSIEYFVRVADLGSITQAARELGIVQPALSRQIQRIEGEVGTPLLLRLPRGVQLTGAGRQFLTHCRRILREVETAKDELAASRATPGGRVVFGVTPTLASWLVPGMIEKARSQCPHVVLKIVEGFSAQLYDRLLTGQLDAALLTNPPASRALRFVPLVSEPIVVLSPPQMRGSRRFYTLTELSKTPIVVSTAIRSIVDEQLSAYGKRLNVEMEVDAIEGIRRLLLRGSGTTVMPLSTCRDDIEQGRLAAFPIADGNVHRMLVLAYPASAHLSAGVQAVAQVVRAEVSAFSDRGFFTSIPTGAATRVRRVARPRNGHRRDALLS